MAMKDMTMRAEEWSVRNNRLTWKVRGKMFSAPILERNRGFYIVGSGRLLIKVFV